MRGRYGSSRYKGREIDETVKKKMESDFTFSMMKLNDAVLVGKGLSLVAK